MPQRVALAVTTGVELLYVPHQTFTIMGDFVQVVITGLMFTAWAFSRCHSGLGAMAAGRDYLILAMPCWVYGTVLVSRIWGGAAYWRNTLKQGTHTALLDLWASVHDQNPEGVKAALRALAPEQINKKGGVSGRVGTLCGVAGANRGAGLRRRGLLPNARLCTSQTPHQPRRCSRPAARSKFACRPPSSAGPSCLTPPSAATRTFSR